MTAKALATRQFSVSSGGHPRKLRARIDDRWPLPVRIAVIAFASLLLWAPLYELIA
jgi:hypothetical protein